MNSQTPVPHDIPLPLPAPEWVLVAVLVGFFLMHIFFITMMVGGTFMTLVYQVKGLKESKWEALAHDLAATITVNKSIAVVLGVGPLLAINTLYTVYFYSANALTGDFWIMIIPLVAGAFLLTYAHKYLWGRLPVWLHLGLISIVVAVFAFVPLIFLTNVNLMLYPERRPDTTTGNGFGSVAISMLVIMIMMGAGRHMYREAAIDDHQALVQQKTETFRALSEDARKRPLQNEANN